MYALSKLNRVSLYVRLPSTERSVVIFEHKTTNKYCFDGSFFIMVSVPQFKMSASSYVVDALFILIIRY